MPIGNGGSILIVLYSIIFVAASPFEAGFKGGVSREIFVCFFPKFIFISFHFDLIKFLSAHHLGVNIDAKKGCEVCATYLGTIGAIKTTRDAYQQQQHSIRSRCERHLQVGTLTIPTKLLDQLFMNKWQLVDGAASVARCWVKKQPKFSKSTFYSFHLKVMLFKISQNVTILATFARTFVAQICQKSHNLVTLMAQTF